MAAILDMHLLGRRSPAFILLSLSIFPRIYFVKPDDIINNVIDWLFPLLHCMSWSFSAQPCIAPAETRAFLDF
jgi:hypothetical protein